MEWIFSYLFDYKNLVVIFIGTFFIYYLYARYGHRTCARGERIPAFSNHLRINSRLYENLKTKDYCKIHFFEEIESQFKNTKPIIFVKPFFRLSEAAGSSKYESTLFTHDDWRRERFLESDWFLIESILQFTAKTDKHILWSEGEDVRFPFVYKKITKTRNNSFFSTENPELTPINSTELRDKLEKTIDGNYTLQIPHDIGILITP